MTDFIPSFATQQLLPPWGAKDLRTSCFLFPLDWKVIQNYLGQFFNLSDPVRGPLYFSALRDAQYGALIISDYKNIFSLNAPNMRRYGADIRTWDHLSYIEISVAIPVDCYTLTPDNLLIDGRPVWIQPVVMCNNSSVVFGSREIVGVDMMHANITLAAAEAPGSIHVDAEFPGIKVFAPDSAQAMLPFLHLETGAALADNGQGIFAEQDAAFVQSLLAKVGGGSALAAGLPVRTELVSLKQFRDAFDITKAEYQAIVSGVSTRENIRDVTLFDPKDVTLEFMWSASATQILGTFLNLGEPGDDPGTTPHNWDAIGRMVRPVVGFSYTCDLTFDQIDTLHTFGAPGR
jgi:hypothetical protein